MLTISVYQYGTFPMPRSVPGRYLALPCFCLVEGNGRDLECFDENIIATVLDTWQMSVRINSFISGLLLLWTASEGRWGVFSLAADSPSAFAGGNSLFEELDPACWALHTGEIERAQLPLVCVSASIAIIELG